MLSMDAIFPAFSSENAVGNAEEVNGFFAALICSPEIAKPNECLAEICGEWPMTTHSPMNKNLTATYFALSLLPDTPLGGGAITQRPTQRAEAQTAIRHWPQPKAPVAPATAGRPAAIPSAPHP
jgi:hypothetical protein